jgi:hypothetical protein
MKHLVGCVLTAMVFWTVSFGLPAPARAARSAHGVILSDGPMPFPGPIPPVQD